MSPSRSAQTVGDQQHQNRAGAQGSRPVSLRGGEQPDRLVAADARHAPALLFRESRKSPQPAAAGMNRRAAVVGRCQMVSQISLDIDDADLIKFNSACPQPLEKSIDCELMAAGRCGRLAALLLSKPQKICGFS